MNKSDTIKELAQNDQTRKILIILMESKTLEEAIQEVKKLLNK